MSHSASSNRLSVSGADEQDLDSRIAVLSAAFPVGTLVTVTRGTGLQPPRHAAEPRGAAFRDAARRSRLTRCAGSSRAMEIRVRVTARANRDELAGLRDGVLHVRVTAPPVDGKANQAVCRLIARAVGVGKTNVTVARGERSRDKLVRIDGVDTESALGALR